MDPRWSQQPPGWQPPSQGWQPPAPQSGLLKASRVLLLVGSIMSAVGAGFILLVATFMGIVFGSIADAEGMGAFGVLLAFYGIFALFLAAGAICGFVAWRKTPGDLDSAFVWGLIGAILQGVNVVTLLGAIFAKTCPEAEASAMRRRQAWSPPQAR